MSRLDELLRRFRSQPGGAKQQPLESSATTAGARDEAPPLSELPTTPPVFDAIRSETLPSDERVGGAEAGTGDGRGLSTAQPATALTQLGIDFGTSTTLVSVRTPLNTAVIEIGPPDEPLAMPSLVALREGVGGTPEVAVVGAAALQYYGVGGHIVVRSVKRHLGCRSGECALAGQGETESWCRGDGLVHTPWGGLPMEDVVAAIVAEALRRAGCEGGTIDGTQAERTVIGCPADAGLAERQSLVQAFRQAGLPDIRFADLGEEPVLAGRALAVLQDLGPGVYVVYDLGGGSFDTAVLELRPNRTAVVYAAGGLRAHGGDDLDRAVLAVVKQQLANEGRDQTVPDSFFAAPASLRQAEQAKRDLTVRQSTAFLVPGGTVTVTRQAFEARMASSRFFERTQSKTLDVYRRARLILKRGYRHDDGTFDRIGWNCQRYNPKTGAVTDPISRINNPRMIGEITGLVAVGAATNVPYLQRRLREWAGDKLIAASALVLSGVSQGATQLASGRDIQLDRLPWSIALTEADGHRSPIVLLPAYTATIQMGRYTSPPQDCSALEPPLQLQLIDADGKPEYRGPFAELVMAAQLEVDVAGRMFFQQLRRVDPITGEEDWGQVACVKNTPWQNQSHHELIAREAELDEAIRALTEFKTSEFYNQDTGRYGRPPGA